MSEPNPTYLNTGDNADDDWEVVDNLIESDPIPPTATDLPVNQGPVMPVYPPVPSRLITHTAKYPASAGAVMALPDDPRRKHLIIHVHGTTDVFVAQDSSALTLGMSTAFVVNAPGSIEIPHYTGAVWIAPDPTAAPTDTFSYSIGSVTA